MLISWFVFYCFEVLATLHSIRKFAPTDFTMPFIDEYVVQGCSSFLSMGRDLYCGLVLGPHVQVLWLPKLCNLHSKKKYRSPATGRGGPRGSGEIKAPDFLDVRHYEGGRSSPIRTGRLYPKRNPWYSFSGAESTPGHMVLSGVPRKKSSVTPPGIDPGTSLLAAQRLNHYATPGHNLHSTYV